ncbi:MAG: TIGR02147 family protein, partial [Proteobacteria bacterium]
TGKSFSSTDGVSSEAIRAYHQSGLDLAKRAISEIPVEKRDFSTLSFAGCAETFAEMVKEIRNCHERVVAIAESGAEKNVVYRLNINLFPYPVFTDPIKE